MSSAKPVNGNELLVRALQQLGNGSLVQRVDAANRL
jgi:hypothetical protein